MNNNSKIWCIYLNGSRKQVRLRIRKCTVEYIHTKWVVFQYDRSLQMSVRRSISDIWFGRKHKSDGWELKVWIREQKRSNHVIYIFWKRDAQTREFYLWRDYQLETTENGGGRRRIQILTDSWDLNQV